MKMDDFLHHGVEDELELLATLKKKYNIDAGRVYLSGFSNGSGMAHFMACAIPS
jgi:poly(3-hydroxybutyrate) depolymerase